MIKKLIRRQVNLNNNQNDANFEVVNQSDNLVLERNLKLPALVFLNVSNSIGSGIYVLTGLASFLYAGQFVSVSYLLAGLACLLSAFCFAEFASIVKSSSGSSYTFIYYSLGEFLAYLIGWMIFIGSLTSIAATAITWSTYLDAITDYKIKNFSINTLHVNWNLNTPFNNYLDIPGILIVVFFFMITLRGVRLTTWFNNTFAVLNITLLFFITIGGFYFGKLENLTKAEYKQGFNGVIKGASVVMYAFMGFESSTYAIEETVNPTRNVPLSMIISVFVICLCYCGSSLSLNLMVPFNQIDTHASFSTAFKNIHFMFFIVSIGPIVSLMGTLIASIYSTARIAYTMSKDGLLFRFLSSVNQNTKIPDKATIFSCLICVLLIIIIDVKSLIGFTDITGFLTYSMMGFALLVVRYCLKEEKQSQDEEEEQTMLESSPDIDESENLLRISINSTTENNNKFYKKFRFFKSKKTALLIIIFIYFSNILYFFILNNFELHSKFFIFFIVLSNFISCFILSLFEQKMANNHLTFKVPFVPFLPVVVIVLNVYLMMASEAIEWIVFGILVLTSLPIYFCYGIKNSRLSNTLTSL